MGVRTEMQSLVSIVQRLVSDAGAATWTSTEAVQQALDAHATRFDYYPMWHDSDYRVYKAQQRMETARNAAQANVRALSPVAFDVPDFGSFYKVGYLANDWSIRTSPTEVSAAQSPDVVDVIGVSFVFSARPNTELFLKATGYNVWNAAADLLLETPDTGREYDTQRRRGQISRSLEQKWSLYRQRGVRLNRRKQRIARW